MSDCVIETGFGGTQVSGKMGPAEYISSTGLHGSYAFFRSMVEDLGGQPGPNQGYSGCPMNCRTLHASCTPES